MLAEHSKSAAIRRRLCSFDETSRQLVEATWLGRNFLSKPFQVRTWRWQRYDTDVRDPPSIITTDCRNLLSYPSYSAASGLSRYRVEVEITSRVPLLLAVIPTPAPVDLPLSSIPDLAEVAVSVERPRHGVLYATVISAGPGQ